ncbi:hypothetical protein L2E82_28164 [Cichorium intybus]|uniref:Uncharacterized protein n=1 Tax=Cichorium intybus TaxID=13427 RepID=A0ACB9CV59_CICIN|nr:hypothetical protein L2E82_28164 [Cichorium intybus]
MATPNATATIMENDENAEQLVAGTEPAATAKLGTIEDNQRLMFDKVVKSFGSIASLLPQNNGTPDETVNEQGSGSGQSTETT